MPALSIKIHRCNEKEPAWPDQKMSAILDFDKCTVIERGMSSGEPSIAFTLIDPASGKAFGVQTSVGVLEMLMSVIKGAREHWVENPVENIWK